MPRDIYDKHWVDSAAAEQAKVNDAGTARYYQQAQLTKPEGYPQQYWDTLDGNQKADVVERASYEKHMARMSTLDAKARRDRIAEGFAYSLVQHYEINDRLTPNEERAQICRAAVFLADALIAELDRA